MAFRKWGTASPSIDRLLGGGLREGRVIEFHGRSGSGKTQLAMQTVLCAARSGATSLFVDTEGSFRPERLETMAASRGWDARRLLDKVVHVRTDSSSAQMELVRRMGKRQETAGCRVVAIDTLTRNFSLDMPGRANAPTRQGALGLHLSEMARDAYLNSRAYILTNRVTSGPSGEATVGGRTVEQLVHATVKLEKAQDSVQATLLPRGVSCTAALDGRGIY